MDPQTPTPAPGRTAAAVDLGSNSFHMIVMRALPSGELRVIDKIKHRVRLAAGLDEDGRLDGAAQERALESLKMMGQRIQSLHAELVRAVGTNTLRKASNALPFLVRASGALGHRIDVISGREEARLIYQGVSHDLPPDQRLLVVDIGGGSTELIIGEAREPLSLDSLYMGCVSWSMRYFPDGRVSPRRFEVARTAARLQLQSAARRYRDLGWGRALGSSGSVRAIERVLRENGLEYDGITAPGMQRLADLLGASKRMERARLSGLSDTRRPVLPGGLAILQAVFEALGVERMAASDHALREGVILDLLGRELDDDARAVATRRFAARFGVDPGHAGRVRDTALLLHDAVAKSWKLDADPNNRRLLAWAAELHEAGIFVSWSGHHKHGAYLIQHADLAGFSRSDQELMAALVLSHRGRLSQERIASVFRGPMHPALRLAVLLRLAHRLHRSRDLDSVQPQVAKVTPSRLRLSFDAAALAAQPLTRADLAEEARILAAVGVRLEVRAVAAPPATPTTAR